MTFQSIGGNLSLRLLIVMCDVRKAKKEGNAEVVNKIETALKIAMVEKGKTLRPEIQLLNQVFVSITFMWWISVPDGKWN